MERRILSRATEFLCFFAEFVTGPRYRGQIRYPMVGFRRPYSMHAWFCHEIHDCHLGSNGKYILNIELSLSEILPVYLVDRLYQSIAVNAYLVGFSKL